jgi:hypothetical protein
MRKGECALPFFSRHRCQIHDLIHRVIFDIVIYVLPRNMETYKLKTKRRNTATSYYVKWIEVTQVTMCIEICQVKFGN